MFGFIANPAGTSPATVAGRNSVRLSRPPVLLRYGVAVLAVALAALARLILWPWLEDSAEYLFFWPAVLAAAWYGGLWPGATATLLGAATAIALFHGHTPAGTLAFGICLFVTIGVFLSLLIQRAAEVEEMRVANSYNRSLIEASPDPLVTIGADGKIADFNSATAKATGRTRDQLVGTDFADYFTEPDKARRGYEEVFRAGSVHDYPLEIRGAGQHTMPVMYNAVLYRDEAGKVLGVFAAARDVTERRRAEQGMKASERRYRSLVQATSLLVWTTDPDGKVGDLPIWREFTGQTMEEVRGDGWLQALHPEDRPHAWAAWSKAVVGRTLYEVEYRVRRRDGEYRDFLARGVPVLDDGGAIREWVGTCADITDRKQAEAQIRKLNVELEQRVKARTAELEAANKEMEAFAYSVSHDLRAPLRAIDGFAQILLKDYVETLPEKPRHYLQLVCDNTRQMGRLIDDILRLSRLGRQSITMETVDPRPLLDQCLEELHAEQIGRSVDIQIGKLPTCWGDANLIRQVWFNLLANALKYTRKCDSARIEIGATIDHGEPVYFVKDNGVGFDMEYVDKLFGVFQRLHPMEEYEGTGIGLALCKRIVQRHGGRIWAEAKVNEGATFFFTLGRKPGHG